MSSTPTDRPLTIEDIRAQQAANEAPSETAPTTETSDSTDVAIRIRTDAGIVLTDKKFRGEFYAWVRKEVESFVPDLTTDKGRKAIASLAFKVSQAKGLIEKAKVALKEDWVKKSRAVDADWREVERDLDALRDQARKPLTDWEEAEEARKKICMATMNRLTAAAIVGIDATVESVHAILADLRNIPTDEDSMQEYASLATEAKDIAVKALSTALARLEREEADRAELAKLRAANEARIRDEMQKAAYEEEERLKKEEAERLRAADEKRIADEKARIENAAKEAADKAARETAERLQREHEAEVAKQKAEQDRIEHERQAELDDARQLQQEAEQKQKAEADRIAREEAARVAEAARLKKIADDKAAEDERLAKNKKNRQERMTAAKLALIQHCGIEEKHAIAVVRMIVDEKIPNISFRFVGQL